MNSLVKVCLREGMNRSGVILVSILLFALVACGGDKKNSTADVSSIEVPAEWGEAMVASTEKLKDAGANIVTVVTDMVVDLEAEKKSKDSFDISDRELFGPRGGKVTISGKVDVESKNGANQYPREIKYKLNLLFEKYESDDGFALNGEYTYEGSLLVKSETKARMSFKLKGKVAYKDAEGVYQLNTEITLVAELDDAKDDLSGTYEFKINGQRITGNVIEFEDE